MVAPLLLVACGYRLPDGPVADLGPATEVRVATWNVERLGVPGDDAFEATVDVLARLDADVVVLQEVGVDEANALAAVAEALGLPVAVAPPIQPFGDVGVGVLASLAVEIDMPSAAELSGDPDANDLTRAPVIVRWALPDAGTEVALIGAHLKSGWLPDDALRRAVEATRLGALARTADADLLLVAGDLNDDPADDDPAAPRWSSPPEAPPPGFVLGRDMVARLASGGLAPDARAALAEAGLAPFPARQRDGDPATRPDSGRVIDAVLGDEAARVGAWRGEVYDPEDDGPGGVADGPGPPRIDAARRASDHLPVVGILAVPRP